MNYRKDGFITFSTSPLARMAWTVLHPMWFFLTLILTARLLWFKNSIQGKRRMSSRGRGGTEHLISRPVPSLSSEAVLEGFRRQIMAGAEAASRRCVHSLPRFAADLVSDSAYSACFELSGCSSSVAAESAAHKIACRRMGGSQVHELCQVLMGRYPWCDLLQVARINLTTLKRHTFTAGADLCEADGRSASATAQERHHS